MAGTRESVLHGQLARLQRAETQLALKRQWRGGTPQIMRLLAALVAEQNRVQRELDELETAARRRRIDEFLRSR